jgi:hypothetical protein
MRRSSRIEGGTWKKNSKELEGRLTAGALFASLIQEIQPRAHRNSKLISHFLDIQKQLPFHLQFNTLPLFTKVRYNTPVRFGPSSNDHCYFAERIVSFLATWGGYSRLGGRAQDILLLFPRRIRIV